VKNRDHRKRPVIIGIGQVVNRSKDEADIKTPPDLIETAIRKAEKDSGAKELIKQTDTLCLVNILSRQYDDPLSELESRLRFKPKNKSYTWIGATAPQWFVNQSAKKILSGETRLALICGGEAFHSGKVEARTKGTVFEQWNPSAKKPWMAGDLRDPITFLELKYGLALPIHIYPLFENALRHHKKLSIQEHREELGNFCAGFSKIAEENPFSWFQKRKTKDEILNITDSNRMISFPYTKSMCSIMQVDLSAALFLTDEQTAHELGVPKEKWIYLRGSGDASDIWHVSERMNFFSSPSAGVAADQAMEQAGVSLEKIDLLDLYSCFPAATRIVRDMIGIPETDPRPLTVTGGMQNFGGPGNNYSLHAICKMVELLRQNKEGLGLVHSLSWFISKHSVGIYSGEWKETHMNQITSDKYNEKLNNIKGPSLIEDASGNATIETYSMFHDREGSPVSAVIIGRMDNGNRFLAKADPDKDLLNEMMKHEFIGKRGRVRSKDGMNIFQV